MARRTAAGRRRGKTDALDRVCATPPDVTTLTVRVPITFRRPSGRKVLLTPGGVTANPVMTIRATENTAIVRALARAFRWRKLIETSVHATVQDIAKAEGINPSYVSRVLRLTLVAPSVIEFLLSHPTEFELCLDRFMRPLPNEWAAQGPLLRRSTGCLLS